MARPIPSASSSSANSPDSKASRGKASGPKPNKPRARPKNTAGALGYALTWALYFGLLCCAGWPRLHQAQLWAEDGKLFLAQAIELGVHSLVVPYDGYLHTVPRLFAYAWVTKFGIARYATAVAIFCYAVLSGVAAIFTLPAYRWMMPSRLQRTLLGALIVFSPGLSEVLGNLANLHYVLLVGMTLFALRAPHRPTALWQMVLLALGCLTEGACWLLLLPYTLRMVVKRIEKRSVYGDLLCLLIIAGAGALHVMAYTDGLSSGATSRADLPLDATLNGLTFLTSERLAIMPWSLGKGIEYLRTFPPVVELRVGFYPLFFLIVALGSCYGFVRAVWVLSLPLTFLLLLALTFLVRPGTLDIIVAHPIGYCARYAFASHWPATLMWATALRRMGKTSGWLAILLLSGLQVFFGAKELPLRGYTPGASSWRAAVAALPVYDDTGRRCLEISPLGWQACFYENFMSQESSAIAAPAVLP